MSDGEPEAAVALLDRLQSAPAGDPVLDGWIDAALRGLRGSVHAETPTPNWSGDLIALLRLVPAEHDFSLGERDGVAWAWVQPNDGWRPPADGMRHDHPRGSGFIVAHTLPLAMAAALVALCAFPGPFRPRE